MRTEDPENVDRKLGEEKEDMSIMISASDGCAKVGIGLTKTRKLDVQGVLHGSEILGTQGLGINSPIGNLRPIVSKTPFL
jgi:hypothetical protein